MLKILKFVLLLQRPSTGSLPDLHLSLELQLLCLLLPLVLFDLLGSELVNISCWKPILADSPEKLLVGLQKSGLLDEIVVAFGPFDFLFRLVDFVYQG